MQTPAQYLPGGTSWAPVVHALIWTQASLPHPPLRPGVTSTVLWAEAVTQAHAPAHCHCEAFSSQRQVLTLLLQYHSASPHGTEGSEISPLAQAARPTQEADHKGGWGEGLHMRF